MKIVLLYTYNKGFLSSFFFSLSARFKRDGHDVINFSLKHKDYTTLKGDVLLIEKRRGGYFSNYLNIFKLLKLHKPDTVLSNFSYANPSLLLGNILGIKKNIVWFHSLNNQMTPSKSQVFIKKQFLKLADIVIANSYLTEQELHEIYHVPHSKLRVLPFYTNIDEQASSISVNKFVKNKELLNIGCPGRLTKHKNQRIVINALSKLNHTVSRGFHLYFAGRGEDMEDLESLGDSSGIKRYMTFLGNLSPDDMIHFYKNMDLIVLPSLDEAFGLVFIEATSLGVPVLVSSKFGALTFINESEFNLNDFTFNPESIEDLENKLMPYFNQTNLPPHYFSNLYSKTFDKNKIYELVKNVLISST